MNILVLSHEAPPLGGGGGRAGYGLARELAEQGHHVDMVTMGYQDLTPLESENSFALHRVPCLRRKRELSTTDEKISYVWATTRYLRPLLRRVKYDLIHCHFIVPAGLIAYNLRKSGIPYVITAHGSDVEGYNPDYFGWEHRLMKPLWRRIVGQAAALTAPSETVRQLILQEAGGCCPPVHLIPYGFPAERFRCSTREPRVLLVSRLLPRKGFQYFLQAIEGLDIGYEVDLVGEGPHRPELERLARLTPTRVNFWGWVDNESPQMKELYERASIFVFPSESENFPVALMEAMNAGLAIITTNLRGCPEVVADTGLLVPPRDPAALREALQRLLADPAEVARLGDAARRRIADLFDWPIVRAQYEECYGEAVGRRQNVE